MRTLLGRTVAAIAAAALTVLGGAGAAGAQTATRATSYINPDTGKPTANPDVDSGSGCAAPDRDDTQPVGNVASGLNNVHNDACLFDAGGQRIDVQAAFEVTGPAEISACPDPDGAGPKTATKTANRCVLSGYEDANQEYHVRVVGTSAGSATITFCPDPNGNGCADSTVTDKVTVSFVPAGGVATGEPIGLETGGSGRGVVALVALGLVGMVGGATVVTRRSRREAVTAS